MSKSVTVVGAGVIGLTFSLLAQDAGYDVTIVAEHFHEDGKSIKYTSCWAGAHCVSVATKNDHDLHRYDSETFKKLHSMLEADPSLPLMLCPQLEYREHTREKGIDQFSLLEKFHPNFRMLEADEVPAGCTHGAAFTTIMIDTPNYLKYLQDRFVAAGGIIIRRTLSSLIEVLDQPFSTSAIVNCAGIGAFSLVDDKLVYPTRGQTVLVRAPWVKGGVTRTGAGGVYTYIIPRKSGDVIVGGTSEVDDWEAQPRAETTKMIKERGIALCPELLPIDKRGGGIECLDVIEENCGLRPTRKGGIRIELELLEKTPIVHLYGHGGYGYQSSWGSAQAALDLLKSALPVVA